MMCVTTKSPSCLLITSDLQVYALNIGKTNCITLSCSNIADLIVFCLCAIGGLRDHVILHAMESSRQRSEDVAAGHRDVAAAQRDMLAAFSAERSLQEKILDAVLEKRDE